MGLRTKLRGDIRVSFSARAPALFVHLLRSLLLATGAPALSPGPTSAADVEGIKTLEVRELEVTTDPLDHQEDLDDRTPGFATSLDIDLDDHARPSDDLASLLSSAPGVRVRSLGGLGQFGGVQIRGSSSQQVQLFIEGVPQNDSFGGVTDISTLPLGGLQKAEIHRGFIPVVFGGATLGGAINLVGRPPTAVRQGSIFFGLGSFHTREAGVTFSTPLGDKNSPWAMSNHVSYAGSAGDFVYFDDGGTPLLKTDDGNIRRTNNDYERLFGLVRVRRQTTNTEFSQQFRATLREHGIAGRAGTHKSAARQKLVSLRSITRVDIDSPVHRGPSLQWLAGVGFGTRHFIDRLGQVGLSTDNQYSRSLDVFLSPRLFINLWRGASMKCVADTRWELVDIDEQDISDDTNILASGDALRRRAAVGVGLEFEQRIFHDAWRLVPAVRVDAFQSRFRVPAGEGETSDEGQDRLDIAGSPRLGTRLRIAPGVDFRTSVGRYFRPPTMFEMFGDRGYVVGNEGLRPESGWNADLGSVVGLKVDGFSMRLQVAGFISRADDLIQFVQTGLVIRPMNLEGASVRGAESSLSIALWDPILRVTGDYTFIDSINLTPEIEQRGEALPGRPRHEGSANVSIGGKISIRHQLFKARVHYLIDAVSETALDPSGRYSMPARALHGIDLNFHWNEIINVGLQVRNLGDRRLGYVVPAAGSPTPIPVPISDFIGYPLPGRSFFIRLSFISRKNPYVLPPPHHDYNKNSFPSPDFRRIDFIPSFVATRGHIVACGALSRRLQLRPRHARARFDEPQSTWDGERC